MRRVGTDRVGCQLCRQWRSSNGGSVPKNNCMCACIVRACVHVCVHFYACMCMCVHVCLHVCVHVCVHVCAHVRECMNVFKAYNGASTIDHVVIRY